MGAPVTAQLELIPEPKLGRQNAAVYAAMRYGTAWTLPALRVYLLHAYGIPISEAGLSARIRDMRKAPVNATVNRRKNGSLWEYWIAA